MKGVVRAWVPALLWAVALFVASSRPTVPVDLGDGRDKLAHFLAYTVLGLLLARAQTLGGHRVWLALVLGLAYAASDELHQRFVPGRSADLADLAADALGVAAGVAFYHRRRTRPLRTQPDGGHALADSVRT